MQQHILVLIISPSIENAMVDWLLDRDDIQGFTSLPIYGHGAPQYSLSPAEQVAGRKKEVMFQIHLTEQSAREIVNAVQQSFKGAGIHYWLTPMIMSGHIE